MNEKEPHASTSPVVPSRRRLLGSLAAVAAGGLVSRGQAATVSGEMPWQEGIAADALPAPVRQGGLAFFTPAEAATMEAIVDRLIPADELGAGAREAGCVRFIDLQLAGDFGKAASLYREGPFMPGTPEQGPQDKATPAERYRSGLAALDAALRKRSDKAFTELTAAQQDTTLEQMEAGKLDLGTVDTKALFELILQNTREGYLSDPMYGGNRDMVGWKLVGFPGARYDFRDVVGRRGQDLHIIPVSMIDKSR